MNCAIKRLNARVSEYKEPEKFDAFTPNGSKTVTLEDPIYG